MVLLFRLRDGTVLTKSFVLQLAALSPPSPHDCESVADQSTNRLVKKQQH